jgi:polysaccharide biosynthesis protein PslG
MRTTRSHAAAALACGLLAALPAPAGAIKVRASEDAVGVSVNGMWDRAGNPRPIADAHVKIIAEEGIRSGRTDAMWGYVEPRAPRNGRHTYDWDRLDSAAQLLAEDGVRWLAILDYSTFWSTSVPGTDHAPPVWDADFAAYAEAFARRYGHGGDFWRERPWLQELPVTTYEVWNEPNLAHFWQPAPDPARYANLYAAARDAVSRADPKATVLVGGLAAYADDYVEDMFAARRDLRGNVDGVAYHPYAHDAEQVLRLVRKLRETLDDLGEDDTPMQITEVGWPTQGTGGLSAEALPDETRAANLSLVTDALLASNCDIEGLSPYTWATPERDPEHDEQWLGIYHPDTTPTEAGLAYGSAVERNAKAAAGDPKLALELCRDRGTLFADPLKISVSLSAAADADDCYDATVEYRGRPLNDVEVEFVDRRSRPGRSDTTVESEVETSLDGRARLCLRPSSDRSLERTLEASAEVLDVAGSGVARRHVR